MKKDVKKIKVLVCLSGGVDSSVSAALLVQQGFDVTAAFMINYDDAKREDQENCWRHEYRDAVRVAAHLGISLLRWDFTKEYKRDVLDYMYNEYEAGRTPNPDILCNQFVKFGAWLDKAKKFGFDYIATGHYVVVKNGGTSDVILPTKVGGIQKEFVLQKSKDSKKDQTYFLHQLNQDQLAHVIFPVGNYTKTQVRALAKKFNLPTATKEESMGICFVGEVPMKEFLEKKIEHKSGKIVLSSTGEVIGKHDGLAFYTIGQRHLLNLKSPAFASGLWRGKGIQKINSPLYVVSKNTKTNTLTVGSKDDPGLLKKETEVIKMNWIGGQPAEFPIQCEVRLRHQQPLQKAKIENCPPSPKRFGVVKKLGNSKISISFDNPQWGVTPGQFAVLYKNKICLGGGIIA